MSKERRHELLRAAAEAMVDGRDPFDGPSFLSEHHVALEECFQMGEDIARAIRIYLALPEDERLALGVEDAARHAIPGPEGEALARFVGGGIRMQNVVNKLGAGRKR